MESLALPVFSAIASAVVGKVIKPPRPGDSPAAAPAPTVAPVTPMPDPMAQKAMARRRAAMFDAGMMGASDTILTGGSDKLG